MEQFQIETAQNISIGQTPAHIGDRMLAYLIDSFIIGAYLVLAIILLHWVAPDFTGLWSIYLILTLPAFLYYVLLETFMNGQTIGKFLMRTRVVRLDGSTPSFANFFIRWILRIIDVVLSMGGVAVMSILFKGTGQRVGDIAAGTTVITEKNRMALSDTLLRELPNDYTPTFSQVTLLKDHEIQTIKELYDAALRNGDHHIILSLSKQIRKITQITTVLKPTDFVDRIIKDYNFYTQQM